MSEFQEQDRTEDPTPRRREEARRQGQVVFSGDLTFGLIMLVLSFAIPWLQTDWTSQFQSMLQISSRQAEATHWGIHETTLSSRWLLLQVLWLGGPLCLGMWCVSVASAQLQMGGVSMRELKLDWSRLWSPESLTRVFSGTQVLNALLSLLKVLTTLGIGVCVMYVNMNSYSGPVTEVSPILLGKMCFAISLGALAWGVADFGWKWQRNESRLKMTREELKQEAREDMGDPHQKQRRRQLHRDSLQRRTLSDVPQASVVIRNPTHFAVALKYQSGQAGAPIVLAKGTGRFALQIIAKAQQYGVPVLERKPLARALYHLVRVGQEIPAELFHAVAEVLAHVYRIKLRRNG